MDADRSRLFLLSIISVPAACGPGVPGGAPGGSPIPVEDDDGALDPSNGDDGPGPDDAGCQAFFTAIANCYIDRPSTSGYEGGGYEGGGYGNPVMPDLAGLCDELDEVADNYGPDCANAIDEALACMAAFACQDLGQEGLETLCAFEVGRADAYCPDVNQPRPDGTFTGPDSMPSETGADSGPVGCGDPGVFTDSVSCTAQYQSCPDGNSYEVTCTPGTDGGLHTCVCAMNGGVTSMFDVENPCTGAYETLASTMCAFPV